MGSVFRIRSRGLLARTALASRPAVTAPFRPDASRLRPHRYASTDAAAADSSAAKPSLLRRAANVLALGVVFTSVGFFVSASPAIATVNALMNPPSDQESLTMFKPQHEEEVLVESFINNHPLTEAMRKKEGFTESRPHLKIPEPYRNHTLTGGTLTGPGKIVVPPLVFAEDGGKSLVAMSYLGNELCGHPGIIHGGLLATMFDDGLAKCCFAALPYKVGVTANLSINYRAPTKAGSYVVLRATTTKVEGRKAWVEGRIETLVGEGETPVVLADATALFVSPKNAALMTNIFPST